MTRKLGIYVRVSKEEQRKGVSIHDQIQRGIECARRNGFDEYMVLDESGVSGEISFRSRPLLLQLFQNIRAGEITGLFCVDLDRLARPDGIDRELLKLELKKLKVRVFDINQEIILNDINQELLTDIRFLLASFEIKKTSVRIRQKLERNAIDGKVGGGFLLPYGYKKDENKKLVIDHVESVVIKMIFDLSIQGNGTKQIANKLHQLKIPTKRNIIGKSIGKGEYTIKAKNKTISNDKVVWRDAVVYNILTNPIYKGKRLFKGNTYRCPAIVEEGIFDAVQEILKNRKIFKNTTNTYFYQLKGLIKCGKCGNNFYGRKRADNSDNQYICSSQRYQGEYCGTRGINIDYLNDLVWKSLINLDNEVQQFYAWFEEHEMTKKYQHLLSELNMQKQDLQRRIDNLYNLAADGEIDRSYFNPQIEKLKGEDQKIDRGIDQTKKHLKTMDEKAETIDLIRQHIKKFRNQKLSDQEKAFYLQIFIEKVYVYWDHELLQHNIQVDYKIDKLTQYRIGNNHKIDYKKYGWRLAKQQVFKEQIQIRKTFIDSGQGTTMQIPILSVA